MSNVYDEAIKRLEDEIKELRKKSTELKVKKIPQEVKDCAEMIHKTLCKSNHTDQCDWYYDDDTWSNWSRKKYIDVAERLLKITDKDTIKSVMEIIKDYS